jgi:hypothetical protein
VKFTNITVLQRGPDADRLVECLRRRVDEYRVGVQDDPEDSVMVIDRGDAISPDLPSFLENQLDACAAETGLAWHAFLAVPPPPDSAGAAGPTP